MCLGPVPTHPCRNRSSAHPSTRQRARGRTGGEPKSLFSENRGHSSRILHPNGTRGRIFKLSYGGAETEIVSPNFAALSSPIPLAPWKVLDQHPVLVVWKYWFTE